MTIQDGNSSPPPPPVKIFEKEGGLRTLRSRASDAKGDKVINWIIQNMPEGKQTIVIL